MHITMYCESCNAADIFFVGYFLKAPCAKHLLVIKSSFLRKWSSTLVFGISSISKTNRTMDNTVSIVSINCGRKCNRKKKHNSLYFLRDQTQRSRNILKALHGCSNSGFKLLVILPFIIANNLKGELLLWTTTVVLTKVGSFTYKIRKTITLSNNNNNNCIKQTL